MANALAGAGDNDIVLSYFDTLVRQADIRSLGTGCWLTDAVIGFYFEYLQKCKFSSLQHAIAFVPPETAHWMKMTQAPHDVAEACEALKLREKLLVFFPVNDEIDGSKAGGTHWSLLLLSRLHPPDAVAGCCSFKFYHIDSYESHKSKRAALTLAQHLRHALSVENCRNPTFGPQTTTTAGVTKSRPAASMSDESSFGRIPRSSALVTQVPDAPQQTNTSDCGVCVLLFAETLAENLKHGVEVILSSSSSSTDVVRKSADKPTKADEINNVDDAELAKSRRSPSKRIKCKNADSVIMSCLKSRGMSGGSLADASKCSEKRKRIKELIKELSNIFS